jgi:hypothetical protein
MPVVTCLCCHSKLRPPDHLAGRRVTCPHCGEAVRVPEPPKELEPEGDAPAPEGAPSPEDLPLSPPARLGVVSLGLGLASVLILCLPLIGYVSFVLSGVGLVLGTWGVVRAMTGGPWTPSPSLVGGAGARRGFGARALDYPLAGVVACLLALVLALLPTLLG